jgi:hypothetical protein
MALLCGWAEVAQYCRKSPRQLRRYVKTGGMPVVRFGKNVMTSPSMIDVWLLTREQSRRERARAAAVK